MHAKPTEDACKANRRCMQSHGRGSAVAVLLPRVQRPRRAPSRPRASPCRTWARTEAASSASGCASAAERRKAKNTKKSVKRGTRSAKDGRGVVEGL
eukprot:6189837-Pleurochrysis_carterae.AAC.1